MADKLMDCITNPVKCKLLLEIWFSNKNLDYNEFYGHG